MVSYSLRLASNVKTQGTQLKNSTTEPTTATAKKSFFPISRKFRQRSSARSRDSEIVIDGLWRKFRLRNRNRRTFRFVSFRGTRSLGLKLNCDLKNIEGKSSRGNLIDPDQPVFISKRKSWRKNQNKKMEVVVAQVVYNCMLSGQAGFESRDGLRLFSVRNCS